MVLVSFQITLRIWTDGEWWGLHLFAPPVTIVVARTWGSSTPSSMQMGRKLRDSGDHSADDDWVVALIVTMVAVISGLVVLAYGRHSFVTWKSDRVAAAQLGAAFDQIVCMHGCS
eukprot:CAMPEP_0204201272 /NCGR_PEP_ID=MMETSP0361-20130328/67346_1 /ASSEMBLY_ACC=CAM_ASM_000343 /TAXON_ID=268821 /ORGANISM="Scrippsiella Hangoei, Strain SHTV-5" /LENGTH=114 /DNA_ID=CAMNT_0051163871 /DNA_START=279 /DNA_END=620 /DNA_ORIENTATION=+